MGGGFWSLLPVARAERGTEPPSVQRRLRPKAEPASPSSVTWLFPKMPGQAEHTGGETPLQHPAKHLGHTPGGQPGISPPAGGRAPRATQTPLEKTSALPTSPGRPVSGRETGRRSPAPAPPQESQAAAQLTRGGGGGGEAFIKMVTSKPGHL